MYVYVINLPTYGFSRGRVVVMHGWVALTEMLIFNGKGE